MAVLDSCHEFVATPQCCYVLHLAKHCVVHRDIQVVGRTSYASHGFLFLSTVYVCIEARSKVTGNKLKPGPLFGHVR